ncbi:MAG: hypothetical protein L6R39_007114, partial [Caloplaca ligustica]
QFQQTTHLSIPDELLVFFLSESASTGAAQGDAEERKRVREEARRTVGFDPYDESPVKRRGEEYQYRDSREDGWNAGEDEGGYEGQAYTPNRDTPGYSSPRYDEGYGTHGFTYPSPSSPSLRQHPQLRRSQRSKSGSPVSGRKGLQGTPPVRWMASESGTKRGSPLARPGTGITDEGLGSSPGSSLRSPERKKSGEDERAETARPVSSKGPMT